MLLLLLICPVMSDSLWPHGMQHTRPLHSSPSPGVCPGSCPLHQWWHPAISSSDTLLSLCLQSFPASRSFPMSQLLTSGDQNIRTSASASVLPISMQGWLPLRLTGLVSLLSKDPQESSPESHFKGINSLMLCHFYDPALTTICDHWKDHNLKYTDLCQQNDVFAF